MSDEPKLYAVIWKTGDTPGKEVATFLHGGKVLLFGEDSEEVLSAKRVDLFEEAGELLASRNGRRVAVPEDVVEMMFPETKTVAASTLS